MMKPRATRNGWPTCERGYKPRRSRAQGRGRLYASRRGSPMGCTKTAVGAMWVPFLVGLMAVVMGAGCHEDPPLVGVQGRLRLSPEAVALPQTYVGVARQEM